jgi:hypothetical protein
MPSFIRRRSAYRSTTTNIVGLDDIEPMFRRLCAPRDWRGFRGDDLVSILRGFVADNEIPPIELLILTVLHDLSGDPFKFRVVNGYHRFYASIAAGDRLGEASRLSGAVACRCAARASIWRSTISAPSSTRCHRRQCRAPWRGTVLRAPSRHGAGAVRRHRRGLYRPGARGPGGRARHSRSEGTTSSATSGQRRGSGAGLTHCQWRGPIRHTGCLERDPLFPDRAF